MLEWPHQEPGGKDILYRDESFKIIGCCMEVHRELGKGHNEVIYKDSLCLEFGRSDICLEREKEYQVLYKGVVLPHKYFADFVVMDKILLEVKAIDCLTDAHIKQTLNYLAVSRLKLGLLVNFGESSLVFKRVIL